MWMSLCHQDKKALDVWSREIASAGTGMAPGLCQLVGGRPKAVPCLKLFSFLYPKKDLPATITLEDKTEKYEWTAANATGGDAPGSAEAVSDAAAPAEGGRRCRLEEVAVARSGDKGDACNVGVVARRPELLPHLQRELTEEKVAEYFSAVVKGPVTRYV